MQSESKYTVELRGGKYYLYRPDGSKHPGQEAFVWDKKGISRLFSMAAQLNSKAGYG